MTIVLFTAGYPYGSGETFLEAEVPVLARCAERLIIVPQTTEKVCRPVPAGVEIVSPPACQGGIRDILTALVDPEALGELSRLPLHLAHYKVALRAWADAQRWKDWIEAQFGHIQALVCYTYWCDEKSLALALLKRTRPHWRCVTRLHGWDLYQYRHAVPYLPFRSCIAKHLDRLFFISADGLHYFQQTWPDVPQNRLLLARLGTRAPASLNPPAHHLPVVVSCSNLIPLKRVHLIAEAVLACAGQVRWIHFGDGPEESRLRVFVQQHGMASYAELRGRVTNAQLHDFYATHPVALLINVSTSEGLPVSVMEAFSYGIPVMATAVGGTPEIVQDSYNGVLLPADTDAHQVTQKLKTWLSLPTHTQQAMRQAARQTWEQDYQAEQNFERFGRCLIGDIPC